MSRSGYSDDCEDQWAAIRWRGAVQSAIRGKRGQAFLRELAEALDAMPEKRLIVDDLQDSDGEYCTLGVIGAARGLDLSKIDPEDSRAVSEAFGIAEAMAQEIEYENDEGDGLIEMELTGPLTRRDQLYGYKAVLGWRRPTPEERWQRMRAWVAKNINPEPTP